MAGMGATVTSGGQVLFSQQWLQWLPTRKFREQHTKYQVPSVLGSWRPEHHGNGSSGKLTAWSGKQLLVTWSSAFHATSIYLPRTPEDL